jgi:hypothetical protein
LAAVAGLSVVAGAVMSLPPFLRYAKANGRSALPRGLFLVATAVTVAAVAGGIGLAFLARNVSTVDREVGTGPYGAAFLAWASILAVALVAWSATAVVLARRLAFSPAQLRSFSILARSVALAMVLMSIAVIVWWTQMGVEAPWFLHGTSPDRPGSMFDVRLAVTVAAMVLADALAIAGLRRIEPA